MEKAYTTMKSSGVGSIVIGIVILNYVLMVWSVPFGEHCTVTHHIQIAA